MAKMFTVFLKSSKVFHQRHHIRRLSWVPPTGQNTGIELYNCVSKSNAPVILRNNNCASWYTCGPTVYAPSHLGHASCYVKVDIIQRILREYFGINLVTAMNITDIDDKIIKQCTKEMSWREIAKTNEDIFWEDLKLLNVAEPDIKLRVSDHIPHVITYISKLIDKDIAYVGKDKSVYFRIERCDTYGKLQNVNIEKGEHELKEALVDFALWKAAKLNEPYWESPWGKGRPGWHIECSTMASQVFGDSVDFHAGGLDLRFPHHENEEAQSCMYYSKPQWVNYWIHTGQLFVKGQSEKMSKSLHNTISIKDFLRHQSCNDFRMACALSNYRNAMFYSDELMVTAQKTLHKLTEFMADCQAYIDGKKPQIDFESSQNFHSLSRAQELIETALRSDFDTSKAVSHLIHLASNVGKAMNSKNSSEDSYFSSNVHSVMAVKNFCSNILSMFGFNVSQQTRNSTVGSDSPDIDVVLQNLITLRRTIRDEAKRTKNKDLFRVSDDIRNSLNASGVEVKDHERGSSWKVVKK